MEYGNAGNTYDQGYESSQMGAYPNTAGGTNVPYLGQQLFNDPMANMAVQYGQSLAGHGTEMIHKNIEKYVSTSRLKYYFAVDTSYVGKKLGLLLFPYARTDWSMQYNSEEPVAPRYDTNAPDLYIPVMSFVTYILFAGFVLGTQNRFSPEQLGITASTALVWTTIEILVLLLSLYIMNISTGLKVLDLLSYCGYKYVGMIVILALSIVFQSTGYYLALAWTSLSIAFFLVVCVSLIYLLFGLILRSGGGRSIYRKRWFINENGFNNMVRSLRVVLMTQTESEFTQGNKRRLYMLLVIAVAQPALMWWLTRRLVV